MFFDNKCRIIKEWIDSGIEIEEYLEKHTAIGSDEWVKGKKYLEYIYGHIRAMFPLRDELAWYITKKIEVQSSTKMVEL